MSSKENSNSNTENQLKKPMTIVKPIGVIRNTGDPADIQRQVNEIMSKILKNSSSN